MSESLADHASRLLSGIDLERVSLRLDEYVVWHGALHEDGCPCDDTCDCSGKSINDGVNAACRIIKALPQLLMENQTLRQQLAAYGPEICVCAAIRLDDGRIIRGHRHDDCIQTAIKWQNAGQPIEPATATQGFYTTRERFVDRTEGMTLQINAGRFKERVGVQILFSEDLY